MKKYWYEVFKKMPNNEGTMTITSFDTLQEAKKFKKERNFFNEELHIDKWIIKNSFPEPILEIE
jgi:hypothetical protein